MQNSTYALLWLVDDPDVVRLIVAMRQACQAFTDRFRPAPYHAQACTGADIVAVEMWRYTTRPSCTVVDVPLPLPNGASVPFSSAAIRAVASLSESAAGRKMPALRAGWAQGDSSENDAGPLMHVSIVLNDQEHTTVPLNVTSHLDLVLDSSRLSGLLAGGSPQISLGVCDGVATTNKLVEFLDAEFMARLRQLDPVPLRFNSTWLSCVASAPPWRFVAGSSAGREDRLPKRYVLYVGTPVPGYSSDWITELHVGGDDRIQLASSSSGSSTTTSEQLSGLGCPQAVLLNAGVSMATTLLKTLRESKRVPTTRGALLRLLERNCCRYTGYLSRLTLLAWLFEVGVLRLERMSVMSELVPCPVKSCKKQGKARGARRGAQSAAMASVPATQTPTRRYGMMAVVDEDNARRWMESWQRRNEDVPQTEPKGDLASSWPLPGDLVGRASDWLLRSTATWRKSPSGRPYIEVVPLLERLKDVSSVSLLLPVTALAEELRSRGMYLNLLEGRTMSPRSLKTVTRSSTRVPT